MPSILGREGVVRILEPEMSLEERRALERSADTLGDAASRMRGEDVKSLLRAVPELKSAKS